MRGSNRLFSRFPFLFFIVAAFIYANNTWQFSPNYILNKPYDTIVPLIMVGLGVMAYIVRFLMKRNSDETE